MTTPTGSAVPGDAGEARIKLSPELRTKMARRGAIETIAAVLAEDGPLETAEDFEMAATAIVDRGFSDFQPLSPAPRMSGDTTCCKGLAPMRECQCAIDEAAALVAPAPVGVNALTDAQIKDATTEYLSHRGERPYRILRGGQALWEVHMPAMQAAIRSALTAGEPALPSGDGEAQP